MAGRANAEGALLRSQGGPLASVPFVSFPTNRVSRFSRSPSQPVPADVDVLLTPLAITCAVVGRWDVEPLENAAARICREASGRVRTNVFVRDLDLGVVDQFDTRRLEVVVDGLPLPRCANGNRHNSGLPLDKGRRCSAPYSHSERRTL